MFSLQAPSRATLGHLVAQHRALLHIPATTKAGSAPTLHRRVALISARGLYHETMPPEKLAPQLSKGILTPMANPSEVWAEYNDTSQSTDPSKRAFTYFVLAGARSIGAVTARAIVLQCLAQMLPAADVKALASLEFSLDGVEEGKTLLVKWRGKPVFIRHRTPEEITEERAVALSELRDPQTDQERFPADPRFAVCVGVCTHLGCVPLAGEGEFGGWFCPCHGSHYDKSGRIRLGPAPLNLEVPQYRIAENNTLVIG